MPVRLNAKGLGEFIRDHLQEPQTGGRDYVGSMYQAYKDHLRSAGLLGLLEHDSPIPQEQPYHQTAGRSDHKEGDQTGEP